MAFILRETLCDLIENKDVTTFYVGNQGNFDRIAQSSLTKLKQLYPVIDCSIVLAYRNEQIEPFLKGGWNTLYPEGLEKVFPKYAIAKRNQWMVDHSDYVVTYILHSWGGAAQFGEQAKKKRKTVINLATKNTRYGGVL